MLKETLKKLGQQPIIDHWESLHPALQNNLSLDLKSLDLDVLALQRQMILSPSSHQHHIYDSFDSFSYQGNTENKFLGLQQIAQGKVGCILLAGGEGTRLRFSGPKGMFPISVIKHKTLFQLVAEKTVTAGKQAGRLLPLAIMTSPQNHAMTCRYFEDNANFGLSKNQLFFFCQGQLPFLDSNAHLFLETPTKIAKGPDGNGFCFKHFANTGILEDWKSRGIQYLNIILIDNPLADPFDAELIGFHHKNQVDVTIKCTEKKDSNEKVGVLVKDKGLTRVCEYSELPENERNAILLDGQLKHRCANLSLFCFSLSFIEKVSHLNYEDLPLHRAWKGARYLTHDGITKQSDEPLAWKFEAFIFDILSKTDRIQALLYPRHQCFAPLKNAEGNDSPKAVQKAIHQNDRRLLYEITGVESPLYPFELSAEFHYASQQLLTYWKGRSMPASKPKDAYIHPTFNSHEN